MFKKSFENRKNLNLLEDYVSNFDQDVFDKALIGGCPCESCKREVR